MENLNCALIFSLKNYPNAKLTPEKPTYKLSRSKREEHISKGICIFTKDDPISKTKSQVTDMKQIIFCVAHGILVPQSRIQPVPPAVEVWSLNQWMPGKSQKSFFKYMNLFTFK